MEITEDALQQIETMNRLIDLVAEDIEWKETNSFRPSDKMKEIFSLYRELRPKEGKK